MRLFDAKTPHADLALSQHDLLKMLAIVHQSPSAANSTLLHPCFATNTACEGLATLQRSSYYTSLSIVNISILVYSAQTHHQCLMLSIRDVEHQMQQSCASTQRSRFLRFIEYLNIYIPYTAAVMWITVHKPLPTRGTCHHAQLAA